MHNEVGTCAEILARCVVCVMPNSQFCVRKSSSSLSMTGTHKQTAGG